jgi:putative ABC transport system permease protein
MWSQALTIALVVASGIGGFLTTLSAVDSLALARDRFYAQGALCRCVRRPSSARRWRWKARCARCPAWPTCRPPPSRWCASSLPGVSDPIIGQLIGIDRGSPALNR